MCITSETCRANSVIKTALNNLHQAGPNKTHEFCKYTKGNHGLKEILRFLSDLFYVQKHNGMSSVKLKVNSLMYYPAVLLK